MKRLSASRPRRSGSSRAVRGAGLLVIIAAVMLTALAGAARSATGFTEVDLGTLGVGVSGATAINDMGEVAGYVTCYCGGNYPNHAFIWTKADGMIDIGTLGSDPATGSYPNAINNSGQVIGTSGGHAFSWTRAGGMVDLGTGEAVAVNDSGQVVGYSNDGGAIVAFSWTPAGGMVKLVLPGGYLYSAAKAVNSNGEVVGFSSSASFYTHAFAWTAAGGMVDLGTLGPDYPSTLAYGVNDAGQVVGTAFSTSGEQHAFSWTPEGGMVDLGTLGGSSGVAQWVTDDGQVVGLSRTADGSFHGFSWTAAGGLVDLGTLGGIVSQPYAVNGKGQVVGDSMTASGDRHAFSWTAAGGMIDLGGNGALAVNNLGQVVGWGGAGAVLWNPIPVDTTPPTLNVPAGIAADATSSTGAVVAYSVTATDDIDPAPVVSCAPASGTTFPIGDTTVSCSATDASGNTAAAQFVVHVRGAAEQLNELAAAVTGVEPGKSLAATVEIAQWFLAHGQPQAACLTLTAFNLEVRAQSGKKIPAAQATALIANANRIKTVLGCTR